MPSICVTFPLCLNLRELTRLITEANAMKILLVFFAPLSLRILLVLWEVYQATTLRRTDGNPRDSTEVDTDKAKIYVQKTRNSMEKAVNLRESEETGDKIAKPKGIWFRKYCTCRCTRKFCIRTCNRKLFWFS